jgi:hypothetical protein
MFTYLDEQRTRFFFFFILNVFRNLFLCISPFLKTNPTFHIKSHNYTFLMASFTSHAAASTSPTIARNQQDAATSYLQSLEAVPSLPPLSHLLTSDQHDLAAAAAAAAAVAAEHQSPVTSSVNTTPHPTSMAYSTPTTTAAAVTSSDGLYYTQPPVIPPTVPSAMMMGPAGSHPADMFPLDSQFLPLDATTSLANINPYPSIAPRRERNLSVSSSASSDTNKVYSFVAIPGTNQKKRPRRRYDEIERLYHCNWQGCSKAYGTLNHLNAHVSMQKHVSRYLAMKHKPPHNMNNSHIYPLFRALNDHLLNSRKCVKNGEDKRRNAKLLKKPLMNT